MFSKKVFACFVALGLISSPFFISFIEKAVAEEVLIAQSQSSLPTKEEIIQKGVSLGMKNNGVPDAPLDLEYQEYAIQSVSGVFLATKPNSQSLEDLKLLVLEGKGKLMTNPAIKTFAYARGVDEETIANAIINAASNIVQGNCELSGGQCKFTEYKKNGDPEYVFVWHSDSEKLSEDSREFWMFLYG